MVEDNDSDPVESIEQIPASDWTDMDLLTRELARDLLVREIEAETASLARSDGDATRSDADRAASAQLRTRRIEAMQQRQSDLAHRRPPRMT